MVEHQVKRLDWSLPVEAVLGAVSMEKGFGFTLWQFVRAPRRAFEAYLGAERLRFSNPLKLVVLLTALATFVNYQSGAMDQMVAGMSADMDAATNGQSEAVFGLLQRNYNLILMASLPFMALTTRLLYWKRAYNLIEHLALNGFIFAVTTVAYLVAALLVPVWGGVMTVYAIGSVIYQTWAYRRVMGPNWLIAVGAVIIGAVAYMLATGFLVGVLITLQQRGAL